MLQSTLLAIYSSIDIEYIAASNAMICPRHFEFGRHLPRSLENGPGDEIRVRLFCTQLM